MNPEAQQIAIAKASDWKPNPFIRDMSGQVFPQSPPDYLNDLNAMHQAEKVLTQAQDYQYRDSVLPAVCKDGSGMIALTATAAQRAEAFLRTIGKWKEASK